MILGSHVKTPKQYHLQSVNLKGQALVTRQWIFCGVHTQLNRVRSRSLSPRGGLGGSGFWPFFPASLPDCLPLSFILAYIPYPSSTCRIDFSKTDTCPISPYPKWLGVVVKTEQHGSVKCRMLYCNSGSLLLVLFPYCDHFSFQGHLWHAEQKLVLGHFLRPSMTLMMHPRPCVSSAQALGLNMKWAGVTKSLAPQIVI